MRTFEEFVNYIEGKFDEMSEKNGINYISFSLNESLAKPVWNKILGKGYYEKAENYYNKEFSILLNTALDSACRRHGSEGPLYVDPQDYRWSATMFGFEMVLRDIYNEKKAEYERKKALKDFWE